MVSDQIAGGLYFTPGNFRINLEGWYKTMDGMLTYNGANSFYPPLINWEKSFTSGKGKSYGVDLEAIRRLLSLPLPRPHRQPPQSQPHRHLAAHQAMERVLQLELPFRQSHHPAEPRNQA